MKEKLNIDFNPVKEDTSGKQAKRVIWSTKVIETAINGLMLGKKLVANPFYENEIKLLKGDLLFQRTSEEIKEWKRCSEDILYFAEKYCKLLTPEGIKHVKLRNYLKKYLKHLLENRLSIYLACRLCAKTTTSAIFLLWYILFNIDKNALVLGNKRKTAIEILSKVKKIYQELPYFLKPGIYKWNEGEINMDNGCMIMAEATTINSGISFTFHCVLADEFAHIKPNIMEPFYNNLFPVITAGKSRFMITSTLNGYNLFYRLYKSAEAGDNDYAAFKTDWWEVPEWNPDTHQWDKRDETWHLHQVANYGSEEAFNKLFGTNFDIAAKTLIAQKILGKKLQELVEFEEKELPGILFSNKFKWRPDFEPITDLRNNYIITTIDLAEGVGGDSTVYTFYRMVNDGDKELECIGYFKDNELTRALYTFILMLLICQFCNQDRFLLSYEKNTYGDLFYHEINDIMSKNTYIGNMFDPSVFVKYYNDSGSKYHYGVLITSKNKSVHCILYKEDYERGKIVNQSAQYMVELLNFCDDGTGHYKASFGHDDMVMSSILIEFVKETLLYKLMRDDFMMGNSKTDEDIYYNPYAYTPYAYTPPLFDLSKHLSDYEKFINSLKNKLL